jgi:hypothetical protein
MIRYGMMMNECKKTVQFVLVAERTC